MTRAGVAAACIALAAASAFAGGLTDRIAAKYAVKGVDAWYGGQRTVFDFKGYDAWVVEPPNGVEALPGRPWTWTMQWRKAFVPRPLYAHHPHGVEESENTIVDFFN